MARVPTVARCSPVPLHVTLPRRISSSSSSSSSLPSTTAVRIRAAATVLRGVFPAPSHVVELPCASSRRMSLSHVHSSSVACRAARVGPGVVNTAGSQDKERLIQHVLVNDDQLSLLLDLQRKVLQEGTDLGDLATEHSICPSKADGGMLGWVRKGQMVPEFEEVAFSAPLNKVMRVKTKFGWHLLQAVSERNAAFLQDVHAEELHVHLQDAEFVSNAQLIDVREPHEIATASIPGFKAYPLSQFGEWGPRIISDLDSSKETYILCHHGVRSLQAAKWLQTQGFTRLYNVAGGIHQYSLKADQSVPTY